MLKIIPKWTLLFIQNIFYLIKSQYIYMDKLHKFNCNLFETPSKVYIDGRTGSGKSTLSLDIINYFVNNDINTGYVVQPLIYLNNKYEKCSKNIKIYNDCSSDIFEQIYSELHDDKENKKFVLIDYYSIDNIVKSKSFLKLFNFSNILNTNIIITVPLHSKNILDMLPRFDYIFTFNRELTNGIHRIYNTNRKLLGSIQKFSTILGDYAKDYNCVVLDKKNNKIYWYNAIEEKTEKNNTQSWSSWFKSFIY